MGWFIPFMLGSMFAGGTAAVAHNQERKQRKMMEEHHQMMEEHHRRAEAQMNEYHRNAECMYNEQAAVTKKAQAETESKKTFEQNKLNLGVARANRARRHGGIFRDDEENNQYGQYR